MATKDPRDQGYSSNPQEKYTPKKKETVQEEDPTLEAATQKKVESRPAVTSEPWKSSTSQTQSSQEQLYDDEASWGYGGTTTDPRDQGYSSMPAGSLASDDTKSDASTSQTQSSQEQLYDDESSWGYGGTTTTPTTTQPQQFTWTGISLTDSEIDTYKQEMQDRKAELAAEPYVWPEIVDAKPPSRIQDTISEIVTMGQAETHTYNKSDLEDKWDSVAAYQKFNYNQEYLKAIKEGRNPGEYDPDKHVDEVMEKKDKWVKDVIDGAPSSAEILASLAIGFVPGLGTASKWKDMGWAGRAFSIGADVFFFVPIAGQYSAGVRGGKSAAQIMKELSLGIVKSPISVIKDPKGALKQGYWDPTVMVVNPKRLPLATGETKWNTVRINVDELGDAKQAMSVRDDLTEQVMKEGGAGKTIQTLDDVVQEVELTKSALQKTLGPVAVHSTYDIRPYLEGATVGLIGGKQTPTKMFFAPNVHTRFAYADSHGTTLVDGVKGGIIIRDKKVLDKLQGSNKTWKGTVEMERILKPGTDIPAPSQAVTFMGEGGEKLTYLIVGDPLTAKELAKLKIFGAKDTFTSAFVKPVKLKIKPGSSADEMQTAVNKDLASMSRWNDNANDLQKAAKKADDAGDFEKAAEYRRAAEDAMQRAEGFQRRVGITMSTGGSFRVGAMYTGDLPVEALVHGNARVIGKQKPHKGESQLQQEDTFTTTRKSPGRKSSKKTQEQLYDDEASWGYGGRDTTKQSPGKTSTTTTRRAGPKKSSSRRRGGTTKEEEPTLEHRRRPKKSKGDDNRFKVTPRRSKIFTDPRRGPPPPPPGRKRPEDRPGGRKPPGDRPGGRKPPEDRPPGDRPGGRKPPEDRPGGRKPPEDRPGGRKPEDRRGPGRRSGPKREDRRPESSRPERRPPGPRRSGGGRGSAPPPPPPKKTPMFIPSGGGKVYEFPGPQGRSPRKVGAELGLVNVKVDLLTTKQKFTKRKKPSKKDPRDTFEILSYMKANPKKKVYDWGIVDLVVNSDKIYFRKSAL